MKIERFEDINAWQEKVEEVQSYLYIALDQEYITKQQFDQIYEKATTVKNLINEFILYLKEKK